MLRCILNRRAADLNEVIAHPELFLRGIPPVRETYRQWNSNNIGAIHGHSANLRDQRAAWANRWAGAGYEVQMACSWL